MSGRPRQEKELEWSLHPREAHIRLVWLNNHCEQDGRDANSWAGVGWIFGQSDRPWTRRPLFRKVRSRNAARLRRQLEIKRSAAQWR